MLCLHFYRLKKVKCWRCKVSDLEAVYIENLEQDIIKNIAVLKNLDLRKALDVYYKSKLSSQISNREMGVENLDAKYLAEDLIENEPELF